MGNPRQILKGKRAFVTGGGTNIGKGIARRLLEAGAAVTIASRNERVLRATAEDMAREIRGAEIDIEVCDVTEMRDVRSAVEKASRSPAGLDIAVANAGGGNEMGSFLDLDSEAWRRELDLNVIGTANTFRAAALSLGDDGGAFVATSSNVAVSPMLGLAPYSCAKAAVDMMVRTLAIELSPLRIRVNAVRPGIVPHDEPWFPAEAGAAAEAFTADAVARTPVGRLGRPSDVAETVLHLVGPSGAWITGQSITVDGGASLHSSGDLRTVIETLRTISPDPSA